MEIKTLRIRDKNYPRSLKKLPDPPRILYFRGKLRTDEKCFAVVGTRKASNYGKEIAFSIAKDLAKAGMTIVSGLAKGVDTFSHLGALEIEGRTIAVLGTGLDEKSIYPRENLKLAKRILQAEGALISEYPPGVRGAQFTFPQRNRIISGLSLGVLVVEAKFGSGALITAKWAKKQRRKIFAVPGSIHSQNSKGPHSLIKQGAKLVESADDILKELGFPAVREQKIKGETLEENLILSSLKEGCLNIDEIIDKTKLPPRLVSANLSLMEIEGKVKNLGRNTYALNYR